MFTKVNIDRASQIPGWMTYKELTWLAKQARKHQKIVEIGSYMGRSTRAMGDHTTGIVAAIDDFKGPRDMNLPEFMRDGVAEAFVWALGDLLTSGRVSMMVADHATADVNFSPDMVFIDGSHIHEDVLRDITTWKKRLATGGLLCGHDYTNMEDVSRAVNELIDRPKVVKGTSIWYS